MNRKIQHTHLERRAFVYLRQSTPHQVESNRESTQRQYALADRAAFLGWDNSQIERCAPPTGYVYDPEGKLVKDPDESVVAAIGLVFQQFRLLGTAFKVMRYFAQN